MPIEHMPPESICELLEPLCGSGGVSDAPVAEITRTELAAMCKGVSGPDGWQELSMFWPPRLVEAHQAGALVPFFGAGVSAAAGLPLWSAILTEHLRMDRSLLDDPEVSQDPLTQAEYVAQHAGEDYVQATVRHLMSRYKTPATGHVMLACLRPPISITTNYDTLFEVAWTEVNPGIPLDVACTDADLAASGIPWKDYRLSGSRALLLKIHGSVHKPDEQLILTRKSYRHHYRANEDLFSAVTDVLRNRHVLFLGFSHRDPEAVRLVEDAIYKFGLDREADPAATRPHFYSLQFGMRSHTPEIFAARGIVALQPPVTTLDPSIDARSLGLSGALSQLTLAAERGTHASIAFDKKVLEAASGISDELASALDSIASYLPEAEKSLRERDDAPWLGELLAALGPLAGQGVYLLTAEGTILECGVPAGLDRNARLLKHTFRERPYFRQAKTFRKPFVSNSAPSVFNGFSTVFLCQPVLEGVLFRGLLFAAAQVGVWRKPIEIAEHCWNEGLSLLLLDANGIALLPPNNEFPIQSNAGAGAREDTAANQGYDFRSLLSLSRRDSLVSHQARNIIPLTQDDDIYRVAVDLECYTVVTEVHDTRWKLGISLSRSVQP